MLFLGIGIVFLLALLTAYALCRAAADSDRDMEAERFFMEMEAFNWPERDR